jgi:DUF1680 family protein
MGPAADGYLHVKRAWAAGDELALRFPMTARLTSPDQRIDAVRGCVAVERGPLVYCFEPAPGAGTPSGLAGLLVGSPIVERSAQVLGTSVIELACQARNFDLPEGRCWPYYPYGPHQREEPTPSGTAQAGQVFEARAVPYFAWANRERAAMRVWVPKLGPREHWAP